jgi:RNA polymerase sigma-70 factor (ECF subfamily)
MTVESTGRSSGRALVARMARRDPAAMRELFDQFRSTLYGTAFRLLGRQEDAEELVSDVMMRAWRQAESYDATRGSVLAWLLIMTRSMGLDRLRSPAHGTERRSVELEGVTIRSGAASQEEEVFSGQVSARIREGLEELPESQRHTILLAYFSGLTHYEIAEKLNEPLGTVKTRIRLGLHRLKDLLQDIR